MLRYPADFPGRFCLAVDRAYTDAEIALSQAIVAPQADCDAEAVRFVQTVGQVFCTEMCRAISEGNWTVAKARAAMGNRGTFLVAASNAASDIAGKRWGQSPDTVEARLRFTSDLYHGITNPMFHQRAVEAFKSSPAWVEHLQRLADLHAAAAVPHQLPDTSTIQTTKGPDTPNATRIEQFRERVFHATGERITKKEISVAAGYNERSTLQRFQRGETSAAINARFHRVLAMRPDDFQKEYARQLHSTGKQQA